MSKESSLKKLEELLQQLERYPVYRNLNPEVWKSDYQTILNEYLRPGDHRLTEMIFFNFYDSNRKIDYEKVQTATGYIKSFIEYIKEKVPENTPIIKSPQSPDYGNLYYETLQTNTELGKQIVSCKEELNFSNNLIVGQQTRIEYYEKNTVQWDQLDIDKLWLLIRKLPLKQFWALVVAFAFIVGLVYWFGTLTIVHVSK